MSGRLDAQRASGELIVHHLQHGIDDVEGRIERLHAQGSERAQMLAASISALGGSVAVALLSFGTPVVGASGAIFGLFGALLVIGRHIGANILSIAVVLAINLAIGFIPGFNVSWQAHVGGLVVGALIGFIFTRTRAARQRRLQVSLLVVVGLALLALLLVPLLVYR